MENKHAHLQMIQGVVNRLSQNSFLLKGWSVVLISALFALSAQNKNQTFIYLAYLPTIAFWFLDGYFLWQERLFRALYDRVRIMKEEEIDFSMDTSIVKGSVKTWSDVIFSKTLLVFHGILVGLIIIITMAMLCMSKGGK